MQKGKRFFNRFPLIYNCLELISQKRLWKTFLKLFFMNSMCYTNTKHISYESKVTIHHLFSNFISEVYAVDTKSYVKQEAAGKSRWPPAKKEEKWICRNERMRREAESILYGIG